MSNDFFPETGHDTAEIDPAKKSYRPLFLDHFDKKESSNGNSANNGSTNDSMVPDNNGNPPASSSPSQVSATAYPRTYLHFWFIHSFPFYYLSRSRNCQSFMYLLFF